MTHRLPLVSRKFYRSKKSMRQCVIGEINSYPITVVDSGPRSFLSIHSVIFHIVTMRKCNTAIIISNGSLGTLAVHTTIFSEILSK